VRGDGTDSAVLARRKGRHHQPQLVEPLTGLLHTSASVLSDTSRLMPGSGIGWGHLVITANEARKGRGRDGLGPAEVAEQVAEASSAFSVRCGPLG
jgi:hypothetical protein